MKMKQKNTTEKTKKQSKGIGDNRSCLVLQKYKTIE